VVLGINVKDNKAFLVGILLLLRVKHKEKPKSTFVTPRSHIGKR
jgi:hypothetical protein